jgi:hypothetical protein
MLLSAEAEMKTRARELEAEATEQGRQVGRKYGVERVRIEIRTAALKTAVEGKGSVPSDATKQSYKESDAALKRIYDTISAETERIKQELSNKLANLPKESAAKIDKTLGAYKDRGQEEIETRAQSAREVIMDEVRGFGAYPEIAGVSKSGADSTASSVTVQAISGSVNQIGETQGQWRMSTADLESRIQADVKRAVKRLAADRGIRVTFVRDSNGNSDATERFARLMKDEGWRVCSPVLCDIRGTN